MRHRVFASQPRHMHGWRPSKVDHRNFRPSLAFIQGQIPAAYDAGRLMPSILDQGALGSCTAHGGVEVFEAQANLAGKPISNRSRLFLYAITRHIEGTPLTEDSGAEIRDVMKALVFYGAPDESLWPYDISQFSVFPPHTAFVDGYNHKILKYWEAPDLLHIKTAIAGDHPVIFGFSVPQNMESEHAATAGEVLYPGPGESIIGGHCVVAKGYDDSKVVGGETGAFNCQNSWGTGWGRFGDFWLPYRFFTDGLATDAWFITEEMV